MKHDETRGGGPQGQRTDTTPPLWNLLPRMASRKWHIPPQDLTCKALEQWYNDRAKYRWTPIGKGKNGAIRFRCPQCDGRVITNAKTWRHRHRPHKPNPDTPYVGPIKTEYCCTGTVTIPVEKLDTYQLIPYGTTAWKNSYNRRTQIENLNGIIKDRGALKNGWCRTFGLAPHNLGLLALLIANNLRQAMKHENLRPSAESNGHEPLPPSPPPIPASTPHATGRQPEDHPTSTHRLLNTDSPPLSALARPNNTTAQPTNSRRPNARPKHRPKRSKPPQNQGKQRKPAWKHLNGKEKKIKSQGPLGGAGGNRTHDLRVKSPLLCQLSYSPAPQDTTWSGSIPLELA